VRTWPTPDFFEGMLLGNGDIGVSVTVRPDALGLHIGKLDVWDIRVSEDHIQHLKPFSEILAMWREAGERAKQAEKPDATYLETTDPLLREYTDKLRSSYAKPWPRPWPCGIVWLHWDARTTTVKRQALDISSGLYTLETEHDDLRGRITPHRLECFVNWDDGHISLAGNIPIVSVCYYPHIDRQSQMPAPALSCDEQGILCEQRLPATVPGDTPSAQDRTFAIGGRLAGKWTADAPQPNRTRAFLKRADATPFRLDLTLFTSVDHAQPARHASSQAAALGAQPFQTARDATARAWGNFWSRSAVELADRELERMWYHNQYFLACCLRQGKVAPGLFGNWSSGNIGTAWHGDYHMNYNTQQVFWGVFSSNHVDQHLPYVDLVESLMPIAEWNAREQFGLPGAYFPHSAYPVPSKVNAYPVPPWGYEICETPWTVQSLWWHYLYTRDVDYLKRAYPLLKAATVFLAAFVTKEADGRYHITPTVSPENWGCTVDFRLNRDCIVDLALSEFVLDAAVEAAHVLDRDAAERERWAEIRQNLAPYPGIDGPYGRVWLDVPGAPAEWVYNVPATLAPVFPADQVGLDRRTDLLEVARRTARTIRLEGGNDLVWQPLARARLDLLDLDWFKREVQYCLLPNGIANDRCRQIDGRYRDDTNFDFMMRMGVWTENLSLPAVLNECMLQSYSGTIRFFPNTRNLGPARFENLRAVGAFLASAAWDGKRITDARLLSEKGGEARVRKPWQNTRVLSGGKPVSVAHEGGVLRFQTSPGAEYRFVA
jgi:hypothetical protein